MNRLSFLLSFIVVLLANNFAHAEAIGIAFPQDAAPRVRFGAERLASAINSIGNEATIMTNIVDLARIQIAINNKPILESEGLHFQSSGGKLAICGGGDSGALYGYLELARRIRSDNALPTNLDFRDAPTSKLRGTCFGMPKATILPGRKAYEYPYTPELFPFFYDKTYWHECLDFLVEYRMNTLYSWNSYPFASLVKLDDYPYALEVSLEVFAKNVEIFRYIAEECDKRGIWLVQMFYNIIVSHYATKVEAAILIMRFEQAHQMPLLVQALEKLRSSFKSFSNLTALTNRTYQFTSSVQTDLRRIHVTGAIGVEPVNSHWSQLLPTLENELANFKTAVASAKTGDGNELFRRKPKQLRKTAVKVFSLHAEAYTVQTGTRAFNNQHWRIQALVPELDQLTAIRFPHTTAAAGQYELVEFEVEEPVLVLIGYLRSENPEWLQPPRLETDALGGKRGGTEVYIQDAAMIATLPPVDVYALRFDKGRHKLTLQGQGSFTVLGIAVEEND